MRPDVMVDDQHCLVIMKWSWFMFSTPDAPWCEIRPTHASATFVATQFFSKKKERWEEGIGVKGRNEPRNIMWVHEGI